MTLKCSFAIAIAVLATIFAEGVAAQAASGPKTRAEVKSATRAAESQGQLLPRGEGPDATLQAPSMSTKTRLQRKDETRTAAQGKQLVPAGEGGATGPQLAASSSKTRAERKAETRAAARGKELVPAGEGGDAPKK